MPVQSESFDVAVVGGGAIGLACAWRASQRGARVVVIDAGEPGAWHVAAGMLAPVSEAEFGERALLRARAWRARAATRRSAPSSRTPATARSGTLVVARDRDEAEALDRLAAFRRDLGLPVERLRPSQARTPRARAGADDPARAGHRGRPLDRPAHARRRARPRHLAAIVRRARVAGLVVAGERVTGVTDARRADRSPTPSSSPRVSTSRGWTCPTHARVPVRPVKGQVLRLRDPRGPGLVERTIRGEHAYFVPRGDGRYVLGATMEERGWDTTPTAGGVYELLRDVERARPRRLRARDRGADRRPAARDARQPARDRPRRARRPDLGHRALPQRHPADARHRRPGRAARSTGEAAARLGRGRRSAALRRGARMKVAAQRRDRASSRDGATVATALDVARPARRRARRGGRGRRRGRPARAVGRDDIARRGAGGDPARDPGRLRWPSPIRTPTS